MGYIKYIHSFMVSAALYVFSFTWLGGTDDMLKLLLGAMVIDYISGIVLCMFFHKSQKTTNGSYSSAEGFMGILRKAMILGIVWIGYMVEHATGMEGLRNIIVMAFVVNEIVSIIENLGLMGVYIPSPLKKAIDILQSEVDAFGKGDGEDDET